MSYNSSYTLKWVFLRGHPKTPQCSHPIPANAEYCPACGEKVRTVTVDARVRKYISDDPGSMLLVAVGADGQSGKKCSWRNQEEYMRLLSKDLPGILFTLDRRGANWGDISRTYYLDGGRQEAESETVFDKFDLEKLT